MSDLLERLASNSLTSVVHKRIELHVGETCRGNFTVNHLRPLERWLDSVVMSWMRLLYPEKMGNDVVRFRLRHFLYETYTHARIEQLFNIIIEFPDSQPALEDLKVRMKVGA